MPPTHSPDSQPTIIPQPESKDIIITIGNLTDITGSMANEILMVNSALQHEVDYFNTDNAIPGVKFEIITFDSQNLPSHDFPGYSWLVSKGVDAIFTALPSPPNSLHTVVDRDNMPLFVFTLQAGTTISECSICIPVDHPREMLELVCQAIETLGNGINSQDIFAYLMSSERSL